MAIYKGKEDRLFSLPTHVALELSQPYLNVGRTLVTDNFYTCIPLAQNLLDAHTHLVGTVRSNRKGLPVAVTTARLKRGEVIARENSHGIVVLKWKDKGDVTMLSTKHGSGVVDTGRKNRQNEAIKKPEMIVYYNSVKQGVDISDQMSSYHSPVRKSIRWFHKVAVEFIMGTAVVNSLILFNDHCRTLGKAQNQLKIAAFREHLVLWLLNSQPGVSSNATLNGRNSTNSVVSSTHYLQVF
jgi:hypothetical protein